jgi:hypothetical protein
MRSVVVLSARDRGISRLWRWRWRRLGFFPHEKILRTRILVFLDFQRHGFALGPIERLLRRRPHLSRGSLLAEVGRWSYGDDIPLYRQGKSACLLLCTYLFQVLNNTKRRVDQVPSRIHPSGRQTITAHFRLALFTTQGHDAVTKPKAH